MATHLFTVRDMEPSGVGPHNLNWFMVGRVKGEGCRGFGRDFEALLDTDVPAVPTYPVLCSMGKM